jgi:hypothetical protein
MSTKVQVEFKPPMACLGTLTSVAEPKVSKAGKYINIACEVTPDGGGRAQKLWLVFRPEYFSARFNPASIRDDSSQSFVYNANIGFSVKNGKIEHAHPQAEDYYVGRYRVPTLLGLFGENVDAADQLTNELATIEDPDTVVDTLGAAIKELEGTTVGYFMRQKYEESKDEVNPDTGKPVRTPTPYYEFSSFFIPTEKNLRKIQNDAQKANAKRAADGKRGEAFVVAFDADVPFRSGTNN